MLKELALKRLEQIEVPHHMSVDEVAWQKWHKYVTNVVDIDNRKVIWNHEGRGKATLDKFYQKIGEDGCKEVQAVVSDGARGVPCIYKRTFRECIDSAGSFSCKKVSKRCCRHGTEGRTKKGKATRKYRTIRNPALQQEVYPYAE